MKSMLFAAYFVNIMAAYLAYDASKKQKDNLSSTIFFISIAHLILATIFSLNFLWSNHPWLVNVAPLLWFLIIFGLAVELFSLFRKNVPGLFLGAAIHLFLVLPTIFSIGIFILLLAIVELILAFIVFYKNRQLWT